MSIWSYIFVITNPISHHIWRQYRLLFIFSIYHQIGLLQAGLCTYLKYFHLKHSIHKTIVFRILYLSEHIKIFCILNTKIDNQYYNNIAAILLWKIAIFYKILLQYCNNISTQKKRIRLPRTKSLINYTCFGCKNYSTIVITVKLAYHLNDYGCKDTSMLRLLQLYWWAKIIIFSVETTVTFFSVYVRNNKIEILCNIATIFRYIAAT